MPSTIARMSFAILTLIAFMPARGTQNPADQKVRVSTRITQDQIHDSSSIYIVFSLTIENGWHINSSHPADESLIPTGVELSRIQGISSVWVDYPAGEEVSFPYLEKPTQVYNGTVNIVVKLWIHRGMVAGEYSQPVEITYQACNNTICMAPTTLKVTVPFRIVPSHEPQSLLNKDLYNTIIKDIEKRRKVQ